MKAKRIILLAILAAGLLAALPAESVSYINDKATNVKLVLTAEDVNPYQLSLDGADAGTRGNPWRPDIGIKDVSGDVTIIDLVKEGDEWTCEAETLGPHFFLVSYDGGETWGTRALPEGKEGTAPAAPCAPFCFIPRRPRLVVLL